MDTIKIEQEQNGWMRLYVNGKLVIATDAKDVMLRAVRQLIFTDATIVD